MLSVNCPNCGATNIFDETKAIPTYCSFCGGHLPDMTEYVKRNLNLNIDRHYFNMNMQYVDKDIERIDHETRRERVKNIGSGFQSLRWIAFIVFIVLFFILVIKSI